VWGFTHVDSLIPVVPVPTAPPLSPLRQGKPLDLARLAIVWAGGRRSAEAALEETYTDGFLVLKDGEVVQKEDASKDAGRWAAAEGARGQSGGGMGMGGGGGRRGMR
jgi:hypothetical protein